MSFLQKVRAITTLLFDLVCVCVCVCVWYLHMNVLFAGAVVMCMQKPEQNAVSFSTILYLIAMRQGI